MFANLKWIICFCLHLLKIHDVSFQKLVRISSSNLTAATGPTEKMIDVATVTEGDVVELTNNE